MKSRILLFIPILVLAAAACGSSDDDSVGAESSLTITDPWSRQPAEGQTVSAVYGVVANSSDGDVRIVSAASSAAPVVELHETLMDDNGAMSMQEKEDGFVVPAGGSFTFEPGGPHIMFLEIDPASYPSDSVSVMITTDGGETLTFDAEVRAIAGGEMGNMEDVDHSEDGDSMDSDSMSEDSMTEDE
ncbi:MAG: copper chaperone PCu(A)C [Acidimicrobiales bacterium]